MENQIVIAVPPRHEKHAKEFAGRWPMKGGSNVTSFERMKWVFVLGESPVSSTRGIDVKRDFDAIPVVIVTKRHLKKMYSCVDSGAAGGYRDDVIDTEVGEYSRIWFDLQGQEYLNINKPIGSLDMMIQMTAEAESLYRYEELRKLGMQNFAETVSIVSAILQHTENFLIQDSLSDIHKLSRLLAGD